MKATKVKNAYMKKKDPLFVRESLLNAAFELAATKGMKDVTVNNVSELAAVTKGAFFNHFDSKETLVTELMADAIDPIGIKQFDRLIVEQEEFRRMLYSCMTLGPHSPKVQLNVKFGARC